MPQTPVHTSLSTQSFAQPLIHSNAFAFIAQCYVRLCPSSHLRTFPRLDIILSTLARSPALIEVVITFRFPLRSTQRLTPMAGWETRLLPALDTALMEHSASPSIIWRFAASDEDSHDTDDTDVIAHAMPRVHADGRLGFEMYDIGRADGLPYAV